MRKERLELSRVTPLAPKASASTNSATLARTVRSNTRTASPAGHYTSTLLAIGTPKVYEHLGEEAKPILELFIETMLPAGVHSRQNDEDHKPDRIVVLSIQEALSFRKP